MTQKSGTTRVNRDGSRDKNARGPPHEAEDTFTARDGSVGCGAAYRLTPFSVTFGHRLF